MIALDGESACIDPLGPVLLFFICPLYFLIIQPLRMNLYALTKAGAQGMLVCTPKHT